MNKITKSANYIFIFLLALSFMVPVQGQKSPAYDYDSPNYDTFLEEGERKIKSDYQHLYSKKNQKTYLVRTFYPDRKQLIYLRTYKDKAKTLLQGTYKTWSDHGILMEEGEYEQGKKRGVWKYYDPITGLIKEEGKYEQGKEEGPFNYYYEDGSIESTINWRAGKKEGDFVVYNEDGTVYNRGSYQEDEIVEQENLEEALFGTEEEEYEVLEEMPYLDVKKARGIKDSNERKRIADEVLIKLIYGSINYPEHARLMGAEGKAIISFTVMEDGTLGDIYAIRGVCTSIEKESLKVIKGLPKWVPGKKDGKVVRVKYNLPIVFRLN